MKLAGGERREGHESWSSGELLGGQAWIRCLSERKVEGKEKNAPVRLNCHSIEIVNHESQLVRRKLNIREVKGLPVVA